MHDTVPPNQSLNQRFAITTLGCKVNQFEGGSLAEQLIHAGYQQVPFSDVADIYIINSCTVTTRSDRDSRRLIRRAKRQNPDARIVVTGCYAQVAPEELHALPDVTQVIGNADKQHFLALLHEGVSQVTSYQDAPDTPVLPLTSYRDQTRAFLQIQNGCDSGCSYCIVPTARGKSRSVPYPQIIETAQSLFQAGHHELVLTGIHIGAYGLDLQPSQNLSALVQQLLIDCQVERIRLGSLEPTELSDHLIQLIAGESRLCKHLHIPLQSGSDRILAAMNRQYSRSFYAERILAAASCMPRAFIAADLIVGYPGESDTDFQESIELLERLPISDLHIFPYSRRPGTDADTVPGHLPPAVITERAAIAQKVSQSKREGFWRQAIGTTVSVLGNRKMISEQLLEGLSDNYLTVRYPATDDDRNRIVDVTITELVDGALWGNTTNTAKN